MLSNQLHHIDFLKVRVAEDGEKYVGETEWVFCKEKTVLAIVVDGELNRHRNCAETLHFPK